MPRHGSSPGRDRRAGFTLLELIVVLALFALIGTVVTVGASALLRGAQRDGLEHNALTALAAARRAAVMAGQTITLRQSTATRRLEWDGGGVELTGEGEVRLLPPVTAGAILVGGRRIENAVTGVRFHADGTCDPFRLEITHEHKTHVLAIDPWTCSVLAPEPGGQP